MLSRREEHVIGVGEHNVDFQDQAEHAPMTPCALHDSVRIKGAKDNLPQSSSLSLSSKRAWSESSNSLSLTGVIPFSLSLRLKRCQSVLK